MERSKEVFHVFSTNGYLLVEFVCYERNWDTNEITTLVVEYAGREYKLQWNDYDFSYEGEVDYQKGYVL